MFSAVYPLTPPVPTAPFTLTAITLHLTLRRCLESASVARANPMHVSHAHLSLLYCWQVIWPSCLAPTALVAMKKQAGSRYTPACASSRTFSGSASRSVCCSALSGAMATKITQAQALLPYDHGRHYEGISSMCKDVCALPLFPCAPRLMASDRAMWASRPSSSQTPRSCWSRRIETETLRVCRQRDGLRATACHAMAA